MFFLKLAEGKKEIDFLYKARTHPSIDIMLSGTPPSNIEEHENYIKKTQGISRYIYVAYSESVLVGYSQIYDIQKGQLEVGFVI